MGTFLVIARHGNTFLPDETPRRVGSGTDLPLTETERGRNIGRYLRDNGLIPSSVYAAPLLRTIQTARAAIEAANLATEVSILDDFVEIDYGPDENKTEEEVELRLGGGVREKGREIISRWNRYAIVPEGWKVNPDKIISTWLDFAANTVMSNHRNETTLLVTSNGIIRFAPHLTGDFELFASRHQIKVSTGSLCIFEKQNDEKFWTCRAWGLKPSLESGLQEPGARITGSKT
ncbi:MAG: histidine phosphatase family protein [Prevotellaceae bacterium]|jgi:probable phosphoglycerate mutase|nr:histidine phosphatase family protein [Prevotellaceae bacterium]